MVSIWFCTRQPIWGLCDMTICVFLMAAICIPFVLLCPRPRRVGPLCFDGRCLSVSHARLCGGGDEAAGFPGHYRGRGILYGGFPGRTACFFAALHVTMTVILVLLYNYSICWHYFLWTVNVFGTLRFEMTMQYPNNAQGKKCNK